MQAGVKDARALLGGYRAWVAAGYPVATGDQPK
jgi:3-mercaptopyruvate sulfurtransferase SseA